MDELTEEELECLQRSAQPWYKLPDTCTYQGHPLYLKLCADGSNQINNDKTSNNTLIVLLTDIRSSVWLEYFGEWRAIHIRIKVSARETPKSTYTDLSQNDAVAKLLSGLGEYMNRKDSDATLDSKSESEMELILHLTGLSFRIRLDKVSPGLQTRLLYDMVYSPLLGVMNVAQQGSNVHLPSMQSELDKNAKSGGEMTMDPQLLAAMQRFAQAAVGVTPKARVPIADLQEGSSTLDTSATDTGEDSKHTGAGDQVKAQADASEMQARVGDDAAPTSDPDKTIDSSSPGAGRPTSSSKRQGNTAIQVSTSPEPAKGGPATRTRSAASPTPSPPSDDAAPVKMTGKRKSRVIDSPSPEEAGADSDATQESDGEPERDHVTKAKAEPAKKARKSKEREMSAPPQAQGTEVQAEDMFAKEEMSQKRREATPMSKNEAPKQITSPAAPVLKRPAAGASRGAAPKRGRRPGMQWSNFG